MYDIYISNMYMYIYEQYHNITEVSIEIGFSYLIYIYFTDKEDSVLLMTYQLVQISKNTEIILILDISPQG